MRRRDPLRDGSAPGEFDYDWIVIGSGFGGSVASLRLAERGYAVGVLECGRRYHTEDLPKSTWNLRKYFWMPKFGMRGILRLTFFKDVSIISGSGVGGGSLVYGQTLYRGTDRFRDSVNQAIGEETDLDPFYDVAERMLGVVQTPRESSRDRMMIATAEDLGISASSFHPTRVGVFFGEPGKTVPDPYFGGEGPDRAGCTFCGRCMVGCRENAKNSLDKNYLHLAKRRGVEIQADRMVVDVRPIGASDGSDGYEIISRDPGAWVRRRTTALRARGVVFAAGPVGTNQLLASCKIRGSLPGLSDHLGRDVRTNAESIGAITLRDGTADISEGLSISGSLWLNEDMHFEHVTYGGAADSMGGLFLPMTGDGTRVTRPLQLIARIVRHPIDFGRSARMKRWSTRSMAIGAMWNRDGALELRPKKKLFGRGVRLQTHQDPNNPNPTFIPQVNEFLTKMAEKYNGIAQLWATEAFNMPFTAHILGGAVVGTSPTTGVIDSQHRVYGYQKMLVTDGSAMPANAGVNPSLSITALAERAMSTVPAKDGSSVSGGIGYR
ncbi:GMC family oxidoreductase [Gordonia caeni]|uniref:Cholesterol oxidase n=1 Tax=Gordonia caeni TaxID=1007097 RepID=A0ABP7NUW4_9ACTN